MNKTLPLWLPLTDWSCKKLLILRKEMTPNEAKVMTMDQIEQHVERFAKAVGERLYVEMQRDNVIDHGGAAPTATTS